MSSKEIERKWLSKGFPNRSKSCEVVESSIVEQNYVSYDPEIRIKRKNSTYQLTIKGDGNIERDEVNIALSDKDYFNIKTSFTNPLGLINKIYYEYKLSDGKKLEVSYVDDDFYYAEIEFDTLEEAKSYKLPEELSKYLYQEVTNDPNFKMKNYSKSKISK
jgi:CYTH domain-containing protein